MRDTIETNRLTLRPFGANDAAQVATLAGDWDVARMCARIPYPYGENDAHAWFASQTAARAKGASYTFAISTARDGVIGAIGLDAKDEEPLTLGYWLGKPFWSQGYATEAGAAVLAHAVEDLGVDRFRSEHFVENDKSGRVLEKLGFAYTGEVREMACLARSERVPARLMLRPPIGGGGHE